MKRKRKAAKPKPKKPSVSAEAVVDPQVDSDVNEDNNGLDSRMKILAREASSHMSGRHGGLDKPVVNNETAGSAAAKLARVLDSSRAKATSDRVAVQDDRIYEKETKSSQQAPACNKQELDAALSVIRKIMKMNGAMPFNSPVDPIALGIPDYFDVIDIPMDFGTICSNLEKGIEYRNSEDVFKDVQRIWDNCCKYNKKGYILELMKRVKNNFMNQWTAAGLNKEQQTVSNGHLPHDSELDADPSIRHEEAMHACPAGSTVSSCAHLHRNDFSCLNKMQYQPLSPCCGGMFKPHQISYQCPCSVHPGQLALGHHQHDLAPQHNHHTHMHSVNLMNDNSCNQWVNKAIPNLMHSYQASPNCCVMGQSQHRTCLHQSSSSQLSPVQLQTGINAHSAGRNTGDQNHHQHQMDSVHVQAYQPFTNCRPAQEFNQNTSQQLHSSRTEGGRNTAFAGQNASDQNHQQHKMDSVHGQAYPPFINCMPAQEVNQNTSQQLHSSRTEAGRNFGFAGNPDVRPPTESTMNCTKRSTGCSRPPFTDNNSCQQPDQINPTPAQSAFMINIETSHTLQPESSPPEHLHSTSYNNFSKRETQGRGRAHSQEESSSMKNNEQSEPEQNTYQKPSYLLAQLPPPTADCTMKPRKKSRGRPRGGGIKFTEGERISVTTNEQGQPVGPEAKKLIAFLGTLARNGYFLPLTFHDWRAVPSEYKDNVWREVQLRFDIDPISRDSAMQSLGHSWRNWKCLLKTGHYYPHKTDEERLADRDERVPPDQWAALIALWNTESVEERCAKIRANRLQQKNNHVTGNKSSARIPEEQRANRPDGKTVNGKTSKVISQFHEGAKDSTPQQSNKQSDILSNGRTLGPELGPSTSGLPKTTHMEATKTVSEANAEVCYMKEKMTAMEQTCAQMASQMAAMMSMMASMHRIPPDKNVPDTIANTASDQSLPQQAPTMPSPGASSNCQAAPAGSNAGCAFWSTP